MSTKPEIKRRKPAHERLTFKAQTYLTAEEGRRFNKLRREHGVPNAKLVRALIVAAMNHIDDVAPVVVLDFNKSPARVEA